MNADGREMTPEELRSFKPRTGRQWEVGLHLDLGTQLSLHAAAYHITLNNIVRSNLGTAADGRKIGGPIGQSISKGVELEMNYAPSKAFDFSLGYSLTDARIASYTSSKFTDNVAAGNRLERVPRDKVSAWAFYNAPILPQRVLKLGFGVAHTGSFYTSDDNLYQIGSSTIFNSVVSYAATKSLNLQLNVNNLFDTAYYSTVINSTQFIPGEGRNVQLTASLHL